MKDTILSLSKQLISIESTKEKPDLLKKVLDRACEEVKDFYITRFEQNGIPSVLISNVADKKEFKIILNAHLDVVPARSEQFQPVEKEGKLFGRGAYDMKAAAAVEILVFKELAQQLNYPIALQLVTDEEIGGHAGTMYQIDQGIRGEFIIAGENTDLTIINRAKGIMWVKVTTKGTSAHGAYPWLGKNAITKMNTIIAKIMQDYPVPHQAAWETTANIASISTTNLTYNKVPDQCQLMIDVRFIPEDKDKIEEYFKQFLSQDVEVEFVFREPDHFTEEKNTYIQTLGNSIQTIVGKPFQVLPHHGASDIRHYNRVHNDGIEFGPTGFGHHTDEEWVDIASLNTYYEILRDFLLQLNVSGEVVKA